MINSWCFIQIGGPDVASEETIETSMIVEIPEDSSEDVSISHLTSDHCYTFKRGIKPKDLDKAKTKAAMLGETQPSQSQQQPTPPYPFILPKHTTVCGISRKQFCRPHRFVTFETVTFATLSLVLSYFKCTTVLKHVFYPENDCTT